MERGYLGHLLGEIVENSRIYDKTHCKHTLTEDIEWPVTNTDQMKSIEHFNREIK